MHYATRVSYNSQNWQRPTGEARKYEGVTTYNHRYGFGHEDWLFRSDWLIDGWRYAFVQGVNKSHKRLVAGDAPFDLTLFTIQPDSKRRLVAKIKKVECLAGKQALDALDEFKRRGWYDEMLKEVKLVDGDVRGLGAPAWVSYVLNIRFRIANVRSFLPDTFVPTIWPYRRPVSEEKCITASKSCQVALSMA